MRLDISDYDILNSKMGFATVLSTISPVQPVATGEFLCVLAIAICLCLGVALLGLRRLRDRRDLLALRDAARELSRGKQTPERLDFHLPLIEDVWRIILALAVKVRSAERAKETYGEVLSAGRNITEASHDISAAAEELTQLLFRKAGPGFLAAAVVLRDPESGNLTLEAISGLPKQRTSAALLTGFQILFDLESSGEPADWGYEVAGNDSLFSLEALDVGLSLSVPLRNNNGLAGGIWMGFKTGAFVLSPQRKAFFKALAEHAAASFYAAQKVGAIKKQDESEKSFLLGMSHDLRAPGNSALYAIRDLLSGELGSLTEEQHFRLGIIEQGLVAQLELVGDVLDFTKHQKGCLSAKKRSIELRQALQAPFDTFSLNAARRNLTVEISDIPSIAVVFDSRHLNRILANFFSNAVKYTDEGVLSVEFQRKAGHLEIIISDTGIGVEEDQRELLFGEFQRLENSENRSGSGLGLALSKVLAELNDGYVFYQPHRNGGSSFGVGVPIDLVEGKQSFTHDSLQLKTILVVDDEPAVVRTNIRYLRELADTLVPATSVEEAMQLALNIKPDLIVSDLHLKGESAAKLLSALAEQGLSPPVLIVTGSSETHELETLKAMHHVAVLEKPIDRSTLTRAVVELLRNLPAVQTNAA